MRNRKGVVNMEEKVIEREKRDKKENVIQKEKDGLKEGMIEREKDDRKEMIKERGGNNKKKLVKPKVIINKKVPYFLLVIGLLCVAKVVYSYGEMAIVAQGRISDYIGLQIEEQMDELDNEGEGECSETKETSAETAEDTFWNEGLLSASMCQECLEQNNPLCECDEGIKEHGVNGFPNGNDVEEEWNKEGCDDENCSAGHHCEDEDCGADQCCDSDDKENGKEDDKENDKEKCNLCEERYEQSDKEDCIECWECLGCIECIKCEECSECVKCEGREECPDCEKCGECVACLECLGCVQCEKCLNCDACLQCSDCRGDFIYTEDQLPKIQVRDPDGAHGYYLNSPEITVIHQLDRVDVHYRFTNGAGELTEGIIPEEEDFLLHNPFKDGENTLLVWVELPDQNWEDYRVFKLDSIAPGTPAITIDKPGTNGTIYSNDLVNITFQSFDSGSGVYGYFYKTGSHDDVFIMGETGTITINEEFVGQVDVIAVDYAGNRSEVSRSSPIIIDKNQPIIKMSSTGELGAWNHGAVSVGLQVEEWGVSSGLERVRVYLDGEMIVDRKLSERELEYSFRETLWIEKEASNGVGTNIRVEARDNVGHETVVHQEVLIDTNDPTISFPDAFNHMIIGSDRTIEIVLEDNNLLRYYQVQTTHSPFTGEEGGGDSLIKGEISSTSQNVSIPLEKEGRYTIEVLARDISGREVVKALHVSLDKTSPIIRYVEQLNGKHIPHFQWNYQPGDMIQDEHGFDYNMFLNGGRYQEGVYVDREGEYIFRVTAVDEAGNVNSAQANFVIDNTPPEIYFYNVEEGESYEEELMVGIAVTGHGERIKRVVVNGENSNIERNSQMVQLRFSRAGDYVIAVEADDLAGNVSIEEIAFSIVESSGGIMKDGIGKTGISKQVDRAIDKVGSILPNVLLNSSDGSVNGKGIAGIGLGLLVIGSGVAYVLYRYNANRSEKLSKLKKKE